MISKCFHLRNPRENDQGNFIGLETERGRLSGKEKLNTFYLVNTKLMRTIQHLFSEDGTKGGKEWAL